MKASFLFNDILGTIADNLGALIEFTLIYKTKVLRYHLKLKIANISWEQMVTIRQLKLNLLPCEKQECQITLCN